MFRVAVRVTEALGDSFFRGRVPSWLYVHVSAVWRDASVGFIVASCVNVEIFEIVMDSAFGSI